MRAAQEAQVIPPMESSTSETGAGALSGSVLSGAVLVMEILLGKAGTEGALISGAAGPGGAECAWSGAVRPRPGSRRADEFVTRLVDGGADGLLVERGGGGDGHLTGLGDGRDRGDAVQRGDLLRDRALAVPAGHAG